MIMKGLQRLCNACGNEGYLAAPGIKGLTTIQACDACGRFETDTEAECHALQRHAMGDGHATKTLRQCSHPRINDQRAA